MVDERLESLRRSPMWAALSDEALRTIADAMQPTTYEPGEAILRQGEPGSHLHVLTSGHVDIRVHADGGAVMKVAELHAGDCFGEMSLLSRDPISADVVAAEDCETLTLDRESFNELVAANPTVLREFLRMMSRRLRATSADVSSAREKEQELTRFLQEEKSDQYDELVGTQRTVKELESQVEKQAPLDTPLLIQGERGTGKELVARLIHFRGLRKGGPLVRVDCSEIVATQWGDQLFGAYEGEDESRPRLRAVCYLNLAEGGTLLLKDVDALPLPIQERLGAFLDRDSRPFGDSSRNVRIIATCRGRLTDAAMLVARQASGALPRDGAWAEGARERPSCPGGLPPLGRVSLTLASALSEHVITVPPLRERKRDIPKLASHFLRRHAQRLDKRVERLEDLALTRLVSYNYLIGNVKELEEAIERAVVLTDDETIDAEEIFLGPPPELRPHGFNLLNLPQPFVRLALLRFPKIARVLAAAIFAFILYQCYWGSPAGDGNLGTLLVWSVWWPALVLSFFLAGRAWCALCPMSSAGTMAQRMTKKERRIPGWLKNHDVHLVMAGFFAIVWVEEVTGMRRAPYATGALLLAILVAAVTMSILFPRRTWCRHLCPLGGFAGVCSTSALVELRPAFDVCAAKCTKHFCYIGHNGTDGCPMFQHGMFVRSNQHCVLCLDCVWSCPNGSPRLNVRIPARELWSRLTERSEMGRFVVMLLGLLVAEMLIQRWEEEPHGLVSGLLVEHRFLLLTGLLVLSAAVPLVALWLAARRLDKSPDLPATAHFWQRIAALAPLVAAGFFCHQLGNIPGFDRLQTSIGYEPPGSSATPWVAFSLLSAVQLSILCIGVFITVSILWKLWPPAEETRDGGRRGSWVRGQAVSLAGAVAYWAILVALMLRPQWLAG